MAAKDHQMSVSSAHGISFFAGLLLMIAGVFQALEALSAIVHDQYLVVAPRYIYTFDLTAWGWIHLLIGLALIGIGICLLLGQPWALMAGIVIAALSAVINFTWLPYSPFWAILLIAVDLLIIWALASARAQTRTA
jgi:divalent metal cation (Fe/Co/Zn/Cd) transporter